MPGDEWIKFKRQCYELKSKWRIKISQESNSAHISSQQQQQQHQKEHQKQRSIVTCMRLITHVPFSCQLTRSNVVYESCASKQKIKTSANAISLEIKKASRPRTVLSSWKDFLEKKISSCRKKKSFLRIALFCTGNMMPNESSQHDTHKIPCSHLNVVCFGLFLFLSLSLMDIFPFMEHSTCIRIQLNKPVPFLVTFTTSLNTIHIWFELAADTFLIAICRYFDKFFLRLNFHTFFFSSYLIFFYHFYFNWSL